MMRRGIWGIVGVAGALIVAAVVATQVVGKDGPPLKEAGEQLAGQSLRIRFSREERGLPSGETIMHSAGEGVIAPTGETGRLVTTSSAPSQPERTDETIFRPGEEWIRPEGGARPLPDGKEWIHWSRDDDGASGLIPSDYGRLLTLAEDIKEVGADHYKASVDVQELGQGDGGTTEQRIKQLFSPRVTTQPIEVWLHEDGRPKRLSLVVRTVGGTHMDFDVEFLEIGVDADVEPPPTETVIDGNELSLLGNN